jgi:hypothetical protein
MYENRVKGPKFDSPPQQQKCLDNGGKVVEYTTINFKIEGSNPGNGSD